MFCFTATIIVASRMPSRNMAISELRATRAAAIATRCGMEGCENLAADVIRLNSSARRRWYNSCERGRLVESGYSTTKLTYKDYVRLPADDRRHEIIGGEHYVTPSPSVRHQQISGRLFHAIQTYLDSNLVGKIFYAPLDAMLGEFDIVVPDLVYVSNERLTLRHALYERVGVREYWLVDPSRDTVRVYRARPAGGFAAPTEYAGTATLSSPLFRAFTLSLNPVFAV